MRDGGRSVSWNVASLNILVYEVINLTIIWTLNRQVFPLQRGKSEVTCPLHNNKLYGTWKKKMYNENVITAWKVSKNEVFSGRYFPVFGLNRGKYGPEKNFVFGHFLRSECNIMSQFHYCLLVFMFPVRKLGHRIGSMDERTVRLVHNSLRLGHGNS